MSLKLAVIGAGRMGRAHMRKLQNIEGVRLVAVADSVEELARSAADAFKTKWYTDYQRLLEIERPDAAYVTTPAQFHADPAIAVAESGAALFCEKPLAWTIEQGKKIVEAVEKMGVIAAVGYQLRYGPLIDRAKELLGNAPVALIRAHYYWCVPLVASIRDRRLGGGQIFDQGTHLIDLARYFVGDPDTVFASYTRNAIPPEEFNNWDGYSVTMHFATGAVGSIASTYALFPTISEPPTLDIAARDLLLRLTPRSLHVYQPNEETVIRSQDASSIDHVFVEAVRTKNQKLIRSSPKDALRTLATTLACNISADRGEVVNVEEVLRGEYTWNVS